MVDKKDIKILRDWFNDVVDHLGIKVELQKKCVNKAVRLINKTEIDVPRNRFQPFGAACLKVALEETCDFNWSYNSIEYLCAGDGRICPKRLIRMYTNQVRQITRGCKRRKVKRLAHRGIPISNLGELFPVLKEYKQIHLDDDATKCIFGKIRNWTVVSKTSSSDSLVALGYLGKLQIAIKAALLTEQPVYDGLIESLEYERRIYERLINRMIEQHFTPNFIYYVGTVTCNYGTLLDTTDPKRKKFQKQLKRLGDEYTNDNGEFPRCVASLIIEGLKRYDTFNDNLKKFKNILPPQITTTNLLETMYKTHLMQILFQILYTLLCMQKKKLVHYDLHTSNIAIERNTSGTPFHENVIIYVLNEKDIFYVSAKNNLVKIFDWDFGYSPSVGNNDKLEYDMCIDYARCNKFNRQFDIMHFISSSVDVNGPLMTRIFALMTKIHMDEFKKVPTWWGYGTNMKDIPESFAKLKKIKIISMLKSFVFDPMRKPPFNDSKFIHQSVKNNLVFFVPGITQNKREEIVKDLLRR